MQPLAGLGRVDPHHPLWAAQRHQPLVGADVGGEDGVEFLAQFGHATAGRYVPDNHPAAGAATATTPHEQAAIAAELEHLRPPLGKRQHARQLASVGAVEQHLLLAADGGQRGPGARRDGCTGIDALRADHGLQWDSRRQRRDGRPFRRSGIHRHGHRLLGRGSLAALVLEHASLDPLLDQGPLLFRNGWRVGRHLRLILVGDEFVEVAGGRIARLDRPARATALHETRVACDIEIARLFIGIVAATAPLPEDGEHVVIERELVVRSRGARGDTRDDHREYGGRGSQQLHGGARSFSCQCRAAGCFSD